jgi:hypothetical protein
MFLSCVVVPFPAFFESSLTVDMVWTTPSSASRYPSKIVPSGASVVGAARYTFPSSDLMSIVPLDVKFCVIGALLVSFLVPVTLPRFTCLTVYSSSIVSMPKTPPLPLRTNLCGLVVPFPASWSTAPVRWMMPSMSFSISPLFASESVDTPIEST